MNRNRLREACDFLWNQPAGTKFDVPIVASMFGVDPKSLQAEMIERIRAELFTRIEKKNKKSEAV